MKGLILQLVVSGRRDDWLLHCFFKVCLRMLELLGIFSKELDILRRRFIGTNINKFNNTVCVDIGDCIFTC